MRTVILIANGELTNDFEMEARVRSGCPVVAVDGGSNHCQILGILPDVIVGDLDSIAPGILTSYAGIETYRFPQEKDQTDLELAINLVMEKYLPERVYVYGALGIRTDHLLGNLSLVTRYPGLVYLESARESIWALGKKSFISTRPNQLISLFSIGCSASGVTTSGLQWELVDATLDARFYSISNRALGHAVEVTFRDGTLVCLLQK